MLIEYRDMQAIVDKEVWATFMEGFSKGNVTEQSVIQFVELHRVAIFFGDIRSPTSSGLRRHEV